MTIRYLASESFDAKAEAETLLSRFSNPGTEIVELCTVIDILHSLEEARTAGFMGIAHKWDQTDYEDLFLYLGAGVMAAINVPGNGRAQTFDLTLIGMSYIDKHAPENVQTETFLIAMDERRRTGHENDWQ